MRWRPDPARTAGAAGALVSALARTWRYHVTGADRHAALRGAGFLFLLWHEALLPLLWLHRQQGIAIVVSEATDGRYLAEYGRRLGYTNILGSSTRGGVRALVGAVRFLRQGGAVAFTPDGPRGPRRTLKPGILAAAAKAGVPVLPIHAEARRAWRLRSWDRFMVPKPFTTVRVGYGKPFRVADGDLGLQAGEQQALEALRATEREIAWRDDGATDTD